MRKKIISFEAIRFFLFCIVFLYHGLVLFKEPSIFLRVFSRGGTLAVSTFFCLAGFCISFSKLNTDFSWKYVISSAKNKFLNIYPLHIFSLLLALVLLLLNGEIRKLTFNKVFINILLLQSWFPDIEIRYALNGVSWYLSTYIFCFLMSFILIFFDKKLKMSKKSYLFLLSAFITILFVITIVINTNERFFLYTFPPVRFLDYLCGFFLGKICFLQKDLIKDTRKKFILFSVLEILSILIYLSMLIILHYIPEKFTWSLSCLFPSLLLIFTFFFQRGCVSLLILKWEKIFLYLGSSVLVYFIFHQIIIRFIAYCHINGSIGLILSFILTLLFGILGKKIKNGFRK